jgi:dihydrofolate synthase/folylpolyglutamate synthase
MPHWPLYFWQKQPPRHNLDTINLLLSKLDNPQNKLPPIIHIAGTNGKGSTVAILKSIFEAANYKVQAYTSPHILQFNERIYCNGNYISDEELYIYAEKVRLASEQHNITASFFEITTTIAFLFFADQEADILLLETGLGGRLDATNVITNPLVSFITPISLDHTQYLGPNVCTIAQEKAGIIKAETDVVISCQYEEVMDILIERCLALKSQAIAFGYSFGIGLLDNHYCYIDKFDSISLETLALHGEHQIMNAAAAISCIKQTKINQLYSISNNAIIQGLTLAKWAGRLENVTKQLNSRTHQTEFHNVWMDGAHNEAGAFILSNWMKHNFSGSTCLIIGMTKNRNIDNFIQHFNGIVDQFITVSIESEPSSYNSDYMQKYLQNAGLEASDGENISTALEMLNARTSKPQNIMITGSLFLVADFYKFIQRAMG